MQREAVEQLSRELAGKSPEKILRSAVDFFGASQVALASSFGAEDQVLFDLLHKAQLPVTVFTLDTGRLPQESYDVLDSTRKHYGHEIEVLFPETSAVENMQSRYGPNLFYESVELRREQSVTRSAVAPIEWDGAFGLYKINPLAEVTEEWVWEYIKSNHVPYNALHDRGYPSIGCAPCSRAVKPGEDIRAGRWWWESPEHKECGLHREKH